MRTVSSQSKHGTDSADGGDNAENAKITDNADSADAFPVDGELFSRTLSTVAIIRAGCVSTLSCSLPTI